MYREKIFRFQIQNQIFQRLLKIEAYDMSLSYHIPFAIQRCRCTACLWERSEPHCAHTCGCVSCTVGPHHLLKTIKYLPTWLVSLAVRSVFPLLPWLDLGISQEGVVDFFKKTFKTAFQNFQRLPKLFQSQISRRLKVSEVSRFDCMEVFANRSFCLVDNSGLAY